MNGPPGQSTGSRDPTVERQDGRLAEHARSKTSCKRLRMGVLRMENMILATKSCHRD